MIDLHCHILPGIDDGAPNLNMSILMAKMAVNQGITKILCTPHHNNGRYVNYPEKVFQEVASLQEKLRELKIPLELYGGQEIRISGDLLEKVKMRELLTVDSFNRYLLIEFPSSEIPGYAEQLLFSIIGAGKIPIIVHPERNKGFIRDPNRLLPFLNMGALTQMTAPSYLGLFGKEIQKTAKSMIKNKMIYLLASDAHNTGKRRFLLKEAYEKIEEDFGESTGTYLKKTARAILNGREVPKIKYSEVKNRRFFLF